jgi:large subunit ribosomal protein L3
MAERSFMVTGFWGKKIGMTQVFVNDKMVPVTVIDAANWLITNVRTQERDGYTAIQVGCLRKRYEGKPFSADWLKQLKNYFSLVREVKLEGELPELTLGQPVDFYSLFQGGEKVHVSGTTKGRGFAGCVKRHRFNGPPGSHGSKMGKKPGSISHMRSQGRVIKGKRLPGHMGVDWMMARNLEIVRVEPDAGVLLVKGPVPGNAGSFLYVRKA